MNNDKIPFVIDSTNFTITLSEAKKIMPDAEVGKYAILGNVYDPATGTLYNCRLLIIPDDGWSN